MVLIGCKDIDIANEIKDIYSKLVENKPEYSIIPILDAEIVKLSLNAYICTKISFANMISDLCDKVNADKYKVLNAIGKDKRIGNKYFNPGNSYGGPCFPRDTEAIRIFMQKNNIDFSILDSVKKYNNLHSEILGKKLLKENKDEYIFDSVCYKPKSKIPIIEESATLKIAKYLALNGKKVIIKDDPHLQELVKMKFGNLFYYD